MFSLTSSSNRDLTQDLKTVLEICDTTEFEKQMVNNWNNKIRELFVNIQIKSLTTYKRMLSFKSKKHPWLSVSQKAIERVYTFITSLPEHFRTIAMANAFEKTFLDLLEIKENYLQKPIWKITQSYVEGYTYEFYPNTAVLISANPIYNKFKKYLKPLRQKDVNEVVLPFKEFNYEYMCFTHILPKAVKDKQNLRSVSNWSEVKGVLVFADIEDPVLVRQMLEDYQEEEEDFVDDEFDNLDHADLINNGLFVEYVG